MVDFTRKQMKGLKNEMEKKMATRQVCIRRYHYGYFQKFQDILENICTNDM